MAIATCSLERGSAMDFEIFGFGGVVGLIILIAIAVVIYNVITGRQA